MAKKWKIRLSGTGGQGLIKGAMVLAEAALLDGREATQSSIYGPESRGSSTRSEVNISDDPIYYPAVTTPNMLICLSKEAYEKYSANIAEGGMMILDGDIGKGGSHPGVDVYRVPVTKIARDQVGNELCANIVTLGVINQLANLVSDQAIKESLGRNFTAKILDINVKAFQAGMTAEITKD